MIRGMTGFGSSQLSSGRVRGVVEVKSQNHRYFDIVYYLPIGFASIENKIRQLVSKSIKRGRVTVSIKIVEKPQSKLSFNEVAVKEYLKYAKRLKKNFGLENDLHLSDLITLPGVVESTETLVNAERIWPAIDRSVKQSLNSLSLMRKREGQSLAKDVSALLKRMFLQIKKIQVRAKVLLRDKKKKLTMDEFLSYQRSSDISEEITRLKHYVEEFSLLLKSKVSVGKKLDFVAQEMQRETNTMGAKLQDKVVSNAVIALKSKIEKLREQAQNIE